MSATAQDTPTTIDASWRGWIAENLMLGARVESIVDTLCQHGVDKQVARSETETALLSPYLRGAQRLKNRLAKHDWVLDNQCRLNRLRATAIERRHQLSAEQFLEHYYSANRPVIITGMMEDWPALQRWNFDYFRAHFGNCEVEVQHERDADAQYEMNSDQHKRRMRFGDFVDRVEQAGSSNDLYITANNDSINRKALAGLWDDIVQIPEYLDADHPAGFLWFGPTGTITPFHHDLTNNFMAQCMGRKRLRLVPPCEVGHMYNLKHCFSAVDGRDIDYQRFPDMADVQVIECVIEPGDVLFLPVGMWHFVEALEPSCTITFTNFRWNNSFISHYPEQRDF